VDDTLTLDDLHITLSPFGTLYFSEIIQSSKNVRHTDAIIKQSKWNSIVYVYFSELVEKHPESVEALLQGMNCFFILTRFLSVQLRETLK
jgi:hypothetical protein